jgi:hypothetical protein
MPKQNIFEYELSQRHTYGPTLKNRARRIAYEVFFTVTYPLFAAIRRYHRWQRERTR